MTEKIAVFYATAPDKDTAQAIAHALVTEKLVACVNMFPEMMATYIWDGALCQDNETAFIGKTTPARRAEVEARLVALHPDVEPCVLWHEVAGRRAFAAWVHETCTAAPAQT